MIIQVYSVALEITLKMPELTEEKAESREVVLGFYQLRNYSCTNVTSC